MATNLISARKIVADEIKKGNIKPTAMHTESVYISGVWLIDSKLSLATKKDLTAGVKASRIKLLKGDGKYKKDVYHHPMREQEAKALQDEHARKKQELVSRILG